MFGKTRSESDPNHDRRRLVGEVIRFLRFQVIINTTATGDAESR